MSSCHAGACVLFTLMQGLHVDFNLVRHLGSLLSRLVVVSCGQCEGGKSAAQLLPMVVSSCVSCWPRGWGESAAQLLSMVVSSCVGWPRGWGKSAAHQLTHVVVFVLSAAVRVVRGTLFIKKINEKRKSVKVN